ncbi:MAG: VOC family protein [Thermoplasmata archaeon]|nr:VOC family protein [Thermoplasmata archaeon]MCK4456101.1 VOC family protein [Thermoplasmata archaeon]
MKLTHASIRAKDMDGTIAFYESIGLKLVSRREIPQNEAEIAFLEGPGGGAKLELTHYNRQESYSQAEYENRVFDHIALETDDMDGVLQKVRDSGGNVTDEPFRLSPGGPRIAFFEDPNEVLVELIERS